MDDINVPIFSQAKLEYTKQLVDILYVNIYDGIRSIYDDAKVVYVTKRSPILVIFRSLLEQVPKWNSEIIQNETERIEKSSKCDWLDELLTAVFISHTRILMSIGSNHNFNKINVTIPKTTTFIHKSYINIAREVWKNPYLFDEQVPGHEYQRNMKQLEDMIKLTIEDTIRRQLPIKEILREHLDNPAETKQSQSSQLDMKALVDELRKVTNKNNTDSETSNQYDTDDDNDVADVVDVADVADVVDVTDGMDVTDGTDVIDGNEVVDNNFSNIFSKEEPGGAPVDVLPEPYKDDGDPDEAQIKKATQNIILNDITEPVIEQAYDNTELVSPTKSVNNDNKLEDMVKELSTGAKELSTGAKELSTGAKELSTGATNKQQNGVIKIDKLDTNVSPTINNNMNITPGPITTIVKKTENEPKPFSNTDPTIKTSPFSFDNLYSTVKGEGKVEEIKDDKSKDDKSKDDKVNGDSKSTIVIKDDSVTGINASIMKEVISLDKTEEQIDDTKSLDVFFSDIQKIADPSMNTMEPIKEESKYTLFEDASDKE